MFSMTPTTRVGSWDGSLPPEAEPIHHPTWKKTAAIHTGKIHQKSHKLPVLLALKKSHLQNYLRKISQINGRPYIGLIYGRYLHFRILKFPLIRVSLQSKWPLSSQKPDLDEEPVLACARFRGNGKQQWAAKWWYYGDTMVILWKPRRNYTYIYIYCIYLLYMWNDISIYRNVDVDHQWSEPIRVAHPCFCGLDHQKIPASKLGSPDPEESAELAARASENNELVVTIWEEQGASGSCV